MISILNILFYHPVSEATPDSKITGAYCAVCMLHGLVCRIIVIVNELSEGYAAFLRQSWINNNDQ